MQPHRAGDPGDPAAKVPTYGRVVYSAFRQLAGALVVTT